MKIRMTFDFDDRVRRAIAARTGETMATRRDCQVFVDTVVTAALENATSELDQADERESEKALK